MNVFICLVLISAIIVFSLVFKGFFFERNVFPKMLSGKIYEQRSTWGNAIYFTNFEKRQVEGFKSWSLWSSEGKPKVLDEFRAKMSDGKIGRFVIVSVKSYSDPSDMFHATVADLGYVGEPLLNKNYKEYVEEV